MCFFLIFWRKKSINLKEQIIKKGENMPTYWLISANPKMYDHAKSFSDYGYIDWKQTNKYKVGDVVFIYSAKPIMSIQYKAKVERIDIPFSKIRDDKEYWTDKKAYGEAKGGSYARFRLIEQISSKKMDLSELLKNGLKAAPQKGKMLDGELLDYINANFTDKNQGDYFPEELDENEKIPEGMKTTVMVNKYERSSLARSKCIEKNGISCSICGMNFEKFYGELGKGFIHVHHIVPVSKIGKEYKVDFKKDLVPVCPNCHAMLHRKNSEGKNVSIEELKRIVKKEK